MMLSASSRRAAAAAGRRLIVNQHRHHHHHQLQQRACLSSLNEPTLFPSISTDTTSADIDSSNKNLYDDHMLRSGKRNRNLIVLCDKLIKNLFRNPLIPMVAALSLTTLLSVFPFCIILHCCSGWGIYIFIIALAQ